MPDGTQHLATGIFPPDNPEQISNSQLYVAIMSVRQQNMELETTIKRMKLEIQGFKGEFATYRQSQKDMLDTWTTAKNVLTFIKLLASIGLPLGLIIAAARQWWHG